MPVIMDNPTISQAFPELAPESLQQLFAAIPTGLMLEDPDGRILWLNAELERQLGIEADAILGTTAGDLPLEPPLGRGTSSAEHAALAPNAGCECVRTSHVPVAVRDEGAGCVARFFVATEPTLDRDNPDRQSLLRMLAARAPLDAIDAETGVLDREGIMQVLTAEVSRSRRYANPLSIVMMRVGPQTPQAKVDAMMGDSARLLREHMRWADSIGRFSQFEFLLVLPETGDEGVASLLAKIKANIDDSTVAYRTNLGSAVWQKGDNANLFLDRVLASLSSSNDLN